MNVLIATKHGQGTRDNDFSWTTPGERVLLSGFECDGEYIDGSCGCRRSFIGIDSSRATTTCIVEVDSLETVDTLHKRIIDYYVRTGWANPKDKSSMVEWNEEALEDAMEIAAIAALYKPGDVLERRGDEVGCRGRVPAIAAKYSEITGRTDINGKRTDSGRTETDSDKKRSANTKSGKRAARPAVKRPGSKTRRTKRTAVKAKR